MRSREGFEVRNVKASADCIPCYLRQVLATVKRVSDDEWLHRKVLLEVMSVMQGMDLDRTPAEVASELLRHALKVLGERDPYSAEKERAAKKVSKVARRFARMVEESEDRLLTAVKLAAAGNIIDLGIQDTYDLRKTLRRVLREELAINHIDAFREAIERARTVMYLLDNAGEMFFDVFLLEELRRAGKEITCVARQSPILNDITVDDLISLGFDRLFEIMSTGYDGLGIPLNQCSKAFRQRFDKTDLIVSKGQANFETLEDVGSNIFFILVAKCAKVASVLGVVQGQPVLFKGASS